MKVGKFLFLMLGWVMIAEAGYTQEVLTNGLIAYYPFNGNFADATTNLHNGVSNGTGISFTTDRYGNENSAVHLAGGGFISVTPTPLNVTNDYTLAFWTKLDAPLASVDNFLSTAEDNTGGMNVRVVPNNAVGWAYIASGPGGIDAFLPTNYTVWHFIVSIHQSSNDLLYIDGVLGATGTNTNATSDTGSLWIGRHQNPGSFNYDVHGAMDDISIYGRALSSNEVAQLYAIESAGILEDATASAQIVNGFVVSLTVTFAGVGYSNAPLVHIIGGGGSGALATATISNGMVIGINIADAGSNYLTAPTIVIDPPVIPNPMLNIAAISQLTFSNLIVGSNYQLQLLVSGTWTNQALTLTATNAVFSQFFPGTVGPEAFRLALQPAPSQAFATAQTTNGFVVGTKLTSKGAGYSTAPLVTITGGGGSNATAIAQIGNGMVTNILITSAGINYTTTPKIAIAPPPAGPGISPSVQPFVRIDAANLTPFDSYQVQSSAVVMGPWSNLSGVSFSSTNTTNSQFIAATNDVGFFRLQFGP